MIFRAAEPYSVRPGRFLALGQQFFDEPERDTMKLENLPFAEACERNKHPILEQLETLLPSSGTVLEIGSGTGQHVTWFAPRFPGLVWQPSDRADYLPGLVARIAANTSQNIRQPLLLDVLLDWPDEVFSAVYSANTAHIMGWPAVCAMCEGVAQHLEPDGLFLLYGPFNQDGAFTAESNAAFDRRLRQQDSQMGLRDVEALDTLAARHQMRPAGRFQLPANNQLLVYRKSAV